MNNIKYVKIAGKTYPASLNMLALSNFLEQENVSFEDFDKFITQSLENLFKLFHFILVYGGSRQEKPFEKSIDELADMVGMNINLIHNTIAHFMPDNEKKPKTQRTKKKK